MTALEIVKDHGGDWCGSYGLVSGPGHSSKDRSLKVWEAAGEVYVHSFAGDDWKDCRAYLGLEDKRHDRPALSRAVMPTPCATAPTVVGTAGPTRRVLDLLRTAAPVDLVPDAVGYLQHRKLWPLPPDCALKAHAGAPYYSNGNYIGRFPALLGKVCDINGDLVTVHVTYLQDNRKLSDRCSASLAGTRGRTMGRRMNRMRTLLRRGSGLPGGSGQSALIGILKAMWMTGRNSRRGSPWISGRFISVATDLKLVSYRLEFGVAGSAWAGDN